MSNSIIQDLNNKLDKVEHEIRERQRLDVTAKKGSAKEKLIHDEIYALDRIHESLLEALRMAKAYDKISNTMVDL